MSSNLAGHTRKAGQGFSGLNTLSGDRQLTKAGDTCYGLDGRQIRKAVITAMTFDKQTALKPEKLTAQNIFDAVTIAKRGKKSA